MQHTNLTPDEEMNSLIYETFFYVNIYGSYNLLKTVQFFGLPSIYIISARTLAMTETKIVESQPS